MRIRTLLFGVFSLCILTAAPQRMLDVSTGTFSETMENPVVERTVSSTERDIEISVHNASDVPYVYSEEMDDQDASEENQNSDETVIEGRIWRYYTSCNYFMDPSDDIYLNLCFSGTTEIEGVNYHNCYLWKEELGFSADNACIIAYMREEDGKIYVRYPENAAGVAMEYGIDIIPYSPFMSVLKHDFYELAKDEYLLFDPELEIGNDLVICENPMKAARYRLTSIIKLECLGRLFSKYNFASGFEYFSFAPVLGDPLSLMPIPGSQSIMYQQPWKLVQVIDTESGEIIFDSSMVTSVVDEISGETMIVRETYYDLNGTEIRRPTESGVYIRRQLLDSGAVRSEKMIVR